MRIRSKEALAPPQAAVATPSAGVALNLPVDRVFTYRVPPALEGRAGPGHRVLVPFRGRRLLGVVVETQGESDREGVLDVLEAPDEAPVLSGDLMSLARFIARHYGASLGEALAAMLPRGVRQLSKGRRCTWARLSASASAFDTPPTPGHPGEGHAPSRGPPPTPSPPRPKESTTGAAPPRLTAAQQRVLRALRRHADPAGLSLTDLCQSAGTSAAPVRSLASRGLVILEKGALPAAVAMDGPAAPQDADEPVPERLTAAQESALRAVEDALESERFLAFLLHGVTGSGKTEVYLRAIERCRQQGRQAIVLVPEIALTPQTVRRFRARFSRVQVLHSGLPEAVRARAWTEIRSGSIDVVIGPRSAVFAPLPRPGLFVVDEEQEPSFKQQSSPRYHARDVALMRAQGAGAVVLLGSATPSLESWQNAARGKYTLLSLPERAGPSRPPSVRIVDLRQREEIRDGGRHLGRTLLRALGETLDEGGQALLFQNRRGYATSVSCPRCGFVLSCPGCDLGLTWHRSERIALCHLCGEEKPLPPTCPDCALPRLSLHGVGTQTVEEELRRLFPAIRLARMDSDTMSHRERYAEVLGRFGRGEIDVLLGTQMIAKGLHFPRVLLVGVIAAETSLAVPDFRSAERTFQLLAQVAGRAGRGLREGRVIIQTRKPDHPAIALAAREDYPAFVQRELPDRQRFGYPPWRRLLRVVVRGPREADVQERGLFLRQKLIDAATRSTQILGPAPPPHARIDNCYRRHLLCKMRSVGEVRALLLLLKSLPRAARRVEEIYDVDPFDFQ